MKHSISTDQLQDPATWDDESATVHSAVDEPQAVVSARFSQQKFEYISKAAEARGLSVSAFLRHVVLDHVSDGLPSTS